ncbi:TonB-dependent siderophore receptor [Pseudomonas marginalis]|uniref:TonB-dependent siderophore receptor n=1 Tax=Pseudomonas marginalis TaxID=298 RepID=UPI003868CFB2
MTSPSRALRARTLGLLLLSVQPLCSLPVFAAGSSQHYSIDAGPLDSALSRFGAQAGITMAGSSTLTAGKKTQGLQGNFSTEAGLTQLLLGSGLTYERQDDGSLLLVPSNGDVLELAPTAISGTAYDTSLGRNDGLVASRTMSANKTDTSIMETPQSISVVTRKQIDAQQPQSIGQVLRYTAGVNGEANGVDTRRDTISIRGFDATTGGGIYRDGLRQYSFANQSRAVGEVYGLERVEVLRGPSSVLYGQSSPGGMVNVISKRPTDEPLHELVAQAGSFDRKQLAADFGGPLSEDGVLTYRLTGLWRDSGTQIDYARDDRQFIAPAISWRPSDDTSLTVLASFQKDRNVLGYYALPRVGTLDSSRYGRIATDRFVGDPDFDKYDVEQWSLGYQFEHHLNDIWTFRQNARYSRSYQEQRTIYQYGLDDDQRTVGRFGYLGHEKVKNALLDNHFQAQWNAGRFEHTTLVGIDLQHASTNQLGGGNVVDPLDVYAPVYHQDYSDLDAFYDINQRRQLDQAGVYLSEQLKFDEHWVFNLGGRQDWARSKTVHYATDTAADLKQRDHAFTWRTGVMYLADNGLAPYASYSESFFPNITAVARDGSAFEPETGRQYEVGIKFQPKGSDSYVTVSLFDLTRQNVLTADPANNRFSVATGEIQSRGIELESKAQVSDALELMANYSYSHLEITRSNTADEKGNQPGNTPEQLASLWSQYTIQGGALSGLAIGGGVRYVGKSYIDSQNSEGIPHYTLFDASLSYDLGKLSSSYAGAKLALNASNLTDETYVSQCGYTGDSCKYGYRRNVTGSVSYNW